MADFEVVRSTKIAAPAQRVHGLIDDFHAWRSWSPWEDVDRMVGKDFEKGLARLKSAAESA